MAQPFPLLYAAPISYYAQWIGTNSAFDLHEIYTKQTFRNRMRILGSNGVILLSIPIQKGRSHQFISEVKVATNETWQRVHWRSLVSSYRSSPFFEFYSHLFEPIFLTRYVYLKEFNLAVHKAILLCLDIDVKTTFTLQSHPLEPPDIRADYSQKRAHTLSIMFPKYQQVFSYSSPFVPDLSILDAIFNLGPETSIYLSKVKRIIQLKTLT